MWRVLEIPSRGESWRLVERLGRGGSAEAWRARREGKLLTDEVCLKLPLGAYDEDERRAVLEEARVLSRIRHCHVVSLFDVVEDVTERPVLVLELVRGVDLAELSRSDARAGRRMEPDVVASVGRALCLALGAAQRAIPGGVVHRDVSPHNVLVSTEGEVKLTDFGIARVLERGRWTRSGHIKGKIGYVAPEIVRHEGCVPASDMFSVGVVLYELLAGQRPFVGRDAVETLAEIAAVRHVPLERRAPSVPRELARNVEWMLDADPRRRPEPDVAARALSALAYEQRAAESLRRAVHRSLRPGIVRAAPRDTSSERRALRR